MTGLLSHQSGAKSLDLNRGGAEHVEAEMGANHPVGFGFADRWDSNSGRILESTPVVEPTRLADIALVALPTHAPI